MRPIRGLVSTIKDKALGRKDYLLKRKSKASVRGRGVVLTVQEMELFGLAYFRLIRRPTHPIHLHVRLAWFLAYAAA